ncbi:MAG: signal recognition particle-docking protein FtsY [Lentisphaerae bacterium]|nr:signal recognition particle-docking protein FtsY [Lentisphaerota bacterium]
MASWLSALARTRDAISGALRRLAGAPAAAGPDPAELEESLVRADVSAAIAARVCEGLPSRARDRATDLPHALAAAMEAILPATPAPWTRGDGPSTILVVGVNGSGKTTTCAKLAHRAAQDGLRPLLCAADTFRAAGSDQLRIWADRLGCEVVAGATGADPAAVAYDALGAAVARGSDLLIVDTAGRMHTKQPLMQELVKVRRSLGKRRPGAPEATWIVLDAALGRNAIAQAKTFHEAVPLTGVVVSKLDGSAKGGFVFTLADELKVPVVFAGLGEGAGDLVPFDRARFVRGLLGLEDADAR